MLWEKNREGEKLNLSLQYVCGTLTPETHSGERYHLTIIDHYSCFTEVRLLQNKGEAAYDLKRFLKSNSNLRKIRSKLLLCLKIR